MSTIYQALSAITELGIAAGDVFTPTDADAAYYVCADETNVILAASTLAAYPAVFEPMVELTVEQKLNAIKRKEVDAISWTAAVGDYFTTFEDDTAVYKITGDAGTDFQFRRVDAAGSEQEAAQSGFETDRIYLEIYADSSSSGS